MSRLYRGLWQVEALLVRDGEEPFWEVITPPDTFEQAEHDLRMAGDGIVTPNIESERENTSSHRHDGYRAIRARMKRVPLARARWEYLANYEASDPPKWTEYWEYDDGKGSGRSDEGGADTGGRRPLRQRLDPRRIRLPWRRPH